MLSLAYEVIGKTITLGRYELQFSVSDRVWGQENVSANMTVEVRYLSADALAHAVPVTLMPTSPAALTAGWSPQVTSLYQLPYKQFTVLSELETLSVRHVRGKDLVNWESGYTVE